MDKITFRMRILGPIHSLEKACKEYSKLIPATNNLQQAKVTMASMLDRIRQEVNRLKNIITMD